MRGDYKYIEQNYSEIDIDDYSFRDIYREHYAFVYYVTKDLVHQAVIAEDLTQEVLAKVNNLLEKGDRFDGKNIRGWLRLVSMNHAKDYLKSKVRNTTFILSVSNYDHFNNIEDDSITFPDNDYKFDNALWNYVDDLTPAQSEVLRSVFIDGLSTQEIAANLKVSNNTIKTRKASGLKKLRNRLISREYINR